MARGPCCSSTLVIASIDLEIARIPVKCLIQVIFSGFGYTFKIIYLLPIKNVTNLMTPRVTLARFHCKLHCVERSGPTATAAYFDVKKKTHFTTHIYVKCMSVDPWVDSGTCPPYFLKWRGRPVFCPPIPLGEVTALPNPLGGFKGPTSKGRGGRRGMGMVGEVKERKGEEGRNGKGTHSVSIRSPYFFADLRPW